MGEQNNALVIEGLRFNVDKQLALCTDRGPQGRNSLIQCFRAIAGVNGVADPQRSGLYLDRSISDSTNVIPMVANRDQIFQGNGLITSKPVEVWSSLDSIIIKQQNSAQTRIVIPRPTLLTDNLRIQYSIRGPGSEWSYPPSSDSANLDLSKLETFDQFKSLISFLVEAHSHNPNISSNPGVADSLKTALSEMQRLLPKPIEKPVTKAITIKEPTLDAEDNAALERNFPQSADIRNSIRAVSAHLEALGIVDPNLVKEMIRSRDFATELTRVVMMTQGNVYDANSLVNKNVEDAYQAAFQVILQKHKGITFPSPKSMPNNYIAYFRDRFQIENFTRAVVLMTLTQQLCRTSIDSFILRDLSKKDNWYFSRLISSIGDTCNLQRFKQCTDMEKPPTADTLKKTYADMCKTCSQIKTDEPGLAVKLMVVG